MFLPLQWAIADPCLARILSKSCRYMWPGLLGHACSVAQSCPTLCNPTGCNPPGSSVHGIFWVRKLEWVVIPLPGDLPYPGIEPISPLSPASQADSLPLSHLLEDISLGINLLERQMWRQNIQTVVLDCGPGLVCKLGNGLENG